MALDETGFKLERLPEIIADLRAKAEAEFGPEINTNPDSVFGQLIAVFGDQLATLWEGLQAVYDSQNPSAAEGVSLDDIAALNGVTRLPATPSEATALLTGDPGTVIPAGAQISIDPTGEAFDVDAPTTLDPASPASVDATVTAADSTAYTLTINGTPFTYNSGIGESAADITAQLKLLVDAGTEPVTFTDNLDGTFVLANNDLTTTYTLATTAEIAVDKVSTPTAVTAQETGPTAVPQNVLTLIDSPVAGWDSVTNPEEGQTGTDVESDSALRLRRLQSVGIAGAGTVDAITANLRQLDGVQDAFVVENRTLTTDAGGRPGKSFEAVVTGGDDQEIGQTIWDRKPAGIETHGDITINAIDSLGNTRVVEFSRPTDVFVHLEIDYSLYSEEIFPLDGEAQIAQAAVNSGNLLGIDEDVILQRLHGPIYGAASGIGGLTIRIATSATAGGAPGPFQTTNLEIGPTEIARFDVSRVVVTQV